MIFIDCLALLMILSKWGQSDFLPDPGDVVHLGVIFPLIKCLNDQPLIKGWSQRVTLIKVISHAGCSLNETADERAAKGRLSEAVPIYPGQNKYGARRRCLLTRPAGQRPGDGLWPAPPSPAAAGRPQSVARQTRPSREESRGAAKRRGAFGSAADGEPENYGRQEAVQAFAVLFVCLL